MMKLYLWLGGAAVLIAIGFAGAWKAQSARYAPKLEAAQERTARAELAYTQAVENRQACEAELVRLQAAIGEYIAASDRARLEVAEAAKRAAIEREWWKRRIEGMNLVPLPDVCEPAVRETARRIMEVERVK